jgi:hypothetical protein
MVILRGSARKTYLGKDDLCGGGAHSGNVGDIDARDALKLTNRGSLPCRR